MTVGVVLLRVWVLGNRIGRRIRLLVMGIVIRELAGMVKMLVKE